MKVVRGPWEHSAQSTSPSVPITSSQSSHVCQPRLCLQTPFLGLLLSRGPSPGVCSARPCLPLSLPVLWPCLAAGLRPCCSADGRAAPSLSKRLPRCGCQGLDVPLPGGAAWMEELLLGAITVAWGWGQATWGPVLHPGAGLAEQEGTGTLRPGCFSGRSPCTKASSFCSQSQHTWPWLLLPPGLGSGHWGLGLALMPPAPGSACLGAELLPASLLHVGTRGWGLEAVGLSSSHGMVPGAALVASTPLQARSSSLPPSLSYQLLSRAVPDCPSHLVATSWHPPAPATSSWHSALLPAHPLGHPVRHPHSVGCCGSSWVPCALRRTHYMDAATVGWPEPAGSSEGPCVATVRFPQAGGRALPSHSSGDSRAPAAPRTCQSTTEQPGAGWAPGAKLTATHWDEPRCW